MQNRNKIWLNFLIPFVSDCRTGMSRRGVAIPLVVTLIFGATGFGLMFQNTIRNQRSQDFLIEQDMKSWFAAESGYQWLMAKLGSAPSWSQRYFAPKPSDLQKIPLYADMALGLADTQIFVQELSVGEMAYLIRGNWAQRVDGTGDKNRTVISGTLRMVGPTSGPQILVASERLDLNRQTLQKIATDPQYREYLMETGNPDQLKAVAEWLMVAEVSDAFERADAAQFLPQIMSLARVARRVEQDLAMARFFLRNRPELKGLATSDSSSLMQKIAGITASVQPRDWDLFMASQMAAEVERWPIAAQIQLEPSANGFFELNGTETMPPQEFSTLLRDTMEEDPNMGVGILAQTVVRHQTSMVFDGKQVSVTEILMDGLARDAQRIDDLVKMGEKSQGLGTSTEAKSFGDPAQENAGGAEARGASPQSLPASGTQIRRVPQVRDAGPMVSWIALAFDEKNDLESGPPRFFRRNSNFERQPRLTPRPRAPLFRALQASMPASSDSDNQSVVDMMREIQLQQREEMERASQNQPDGDESSTAYPAVEDPSQQVATVPPAQPPQQAQAQKKDGWYPGKYIGKFMKGVFGGGK